MRVLSLFLTLIPEAFTLLLVFIPFESVIVFLGGLCGLGNKNDFQTGKTVFTISVLSFIVSFSKLIMTQDADKLFIAGATACALVNLLYIFSWMNDQSAKGEAFNLEHTLEPAKVMTNPVSNDTETTASSSQLATPEVTNEASGVRFPQRASKPGAGTIGKTHIRQNRLEMAEVN